MTYKELAYTIHILMADGYMKQEKPLWDMDMYRILKKVNKNIEIYERNK